MDTQEKDMKERLLNFIKYLGISIREFERSIGAANGYVNGITKGLGADRLLTINRLYPALNTDWLLTGEGDMIRPPETPTIVQNISQKNTAGDIHNTANVATDTTRFLDLLQAKEMSLAKAQDHLTTAQEQITQLIKIIADK